jgi:hypothetical protein
MRDREIILEGGPTEKNPGLLTIAYSILFYCRCLSAIFRQVE